MRIEKEDSYQDVTTGNLIRIVEVVLPVYSLSKPIEYHLFLQATYTEEPSLVPIVKTEKGELYADWHQTVVLYQQVNPTDYFSRLYAIPMVKFFEELPKGDGSVGFRFLKQEL